MQAITGQPPLTPFLRLSDLLCEPPEQKSCSAKQHPHALAPSQPQSAACGGWRVRGRRGRGGGWRERAAAAGHAAGGANPHRADREPAEREVGRLACRLSVLSCLLSALHLNKECENKKKTATLVKTTVYNYLYTSAPYDIYNIIHIMILYFTVVTWQPGAVQTMIYEYKPEHVLF